MSNKNKEREVLIRRLQENLAPIRKIAGWTTQNLGDKIGVTKQTISNLENGKTPMTYTQYLAICAVLDDEMENNTENTILPQVIEILLNKNEELSEIDYNIIRHAIVTVSASAASGTTGVALSSLFASTLKGIGIAGASAGALLGAGVFLGPIGIATSAAIPFLLKKALKGD